MIRALRRAFATIRRYPSIGISLFIILSFIGISIYAVVRIPLSEAVTMWHNPITEARESPRCAQPAWTNLFRRENLPETIIVRLDNFESTREALGETAWRETIVVEFDYNYSMLPSEVVVYSNIEYGTKIPIVTLAWVRPDGGKIELFHGAARGAYGRLEMEPREAFGESELDESDTRQGTPDASREPGALKGKYALLIEAMTFEELGFSVGGEIVVYGRVHGIAGTDSQRRDLAIGLMWGTPIALMLGFIAATGTTVFSFVIAAIGAWFGGWIDGAIQRITEVNMMIPFLPVIMMVGWYYSMSIWVVLGFVVGLSIFTGRLKTHRVVFLQLVHAPYIEAARAYGASNVRIIFRYLIPCVFQTLLPHIILAVPLFIFLEASLSFLGIADPNLLTWGNILSDAREALYMEHYYWIFEPLFMLFITALAFSMLGFALDRVFNPRLRGT